MSSLNCLMIVRFTSFKMTCERKVSIWLVDPDPKWAVAPWNYYRNSLAKLLKMIFAPWNYYRNSLAKLLKMTVAPWNYYRNSLAKLLKMTVAPWNYYRNSLAKLLQDDFCNAEQLQIV